MPGLNEPSALQSTVAVGMVTSSLFECSRHGAIVKCRVTAFFALSVRKCWVITAC